MGRQVIAVARDADRIVGFMTIEPGGYIDFAYIRPEAQGTGLFRRLFGQVEEYAKTHGETGVWTHASLMAQPAVRDNAGAVRSHKLAVTKATIFASLFINRVALVFGL